MMRGLGSFHEVIGLNFITINNIIIQKGTLSLETQTNSEYARKL